ncbi:MAG: aquaporin family protein [Candidatus Omnitrophica bacterium]|nr:aquaporin family protein [Candidatus Omnitrophota bacterium]
MQNFAAELIGTMILVLLGDGVVANVLLKKSKGEDSGWIVIATGWGFAVAMAVYVAGWISGGHINPAVTIGFIAIGEISPKEALPYISGQMVGAFLGAVLVWIAYMPHWKGTKNADSKLMVFCTMPAIRKRRWNILTEIIGTAMLLLGVLGINNTHNSISKGAGPYLVGILVLSIGLSLGGPTGYAINPARDLGPRIAHFLLPIPGKRDSDWSYSWVPVLGPIIGCLVGALLYKFVFSCFMK